MGSCGSGGIGGATRCGELMTNGSDAARHRFLQSHLLLGLTPSVPVPNNDHEIQPSARAATFYERYGALWGSLAGKRWLLTPHAVTVPSAAAAANAFELPPYGGGVYAAALAYGPPRGNVTVHLRLPGSPPPSAVAARATLLDGVTADCAASAVDGGAIAVAVPVKDGCAVVTLYVGE